MADEHGSVLENQNEIDRLKRLEKKYEADIKTTETEIKNLGKKSKKKTNYRQRLPNPKNSLLPKKKKEMICNQD